MKPTKKLVSIKSPKDKLIIKKQSETDKVIALAGNPNVGKSTIFNGLTGLNQHTGNWPGKTVTNAQGYCSTENQSYVLVDIPGTYSIMAHSEEEKIARNFICFDNPDAVVVVCDATCLERNLNLVLQTIETTPNVIVCVNLMDEAKRKNIEINLPLLSKRLGVPVIGTSARKKKNLSILMDAVDNVVSKSNDSTQFKVKYNDAIEDCIKLLEPLIQANCNGRLDSRWLSIKLLDQDDSLIQEINTYLGNDFLNNEELKNCIIESKKILENNNIKNENHLKDLIVSALIKSAENICKDVVTYHDHKYDSTDRKIDKVLTSKLTGYPIMLALLGLVFWLTITGANYPSRLLADGLFWIQDKLTVLFIYMNAPDWLHGILVLGVYRVLAWVVSVMLPPMAIFFPLFTLLEDAGYLPRVAYNLDKHFKKCCACGKQSLCMCMGFGCNAAGVIGCRIINSPRERLLAILTNNFVPCNGRFPTLIAILTMFFVGTTGGIFSSIFSAFLLTGVIILGVLITFIVTKFLSKTLLKGYPSSFTLELPPYRKPQIGHVIVRSIFDRTLKVLGRAIIVAAPVGLVIWLMANIFVGDTSILNYCVEFLDPFAKLMGLDGVILIAFILGFPANEIVVPIIIMAYMSQGSILELDSIVEMKELFVSNGWTWITAISTILFSLNHWPCSTTLLTIRKETGSWKWTLIAAAIPTFVGIGICVIFNIFANLLS